MAFWKVAGFSQPSPIEQILDKEEYTLEELLDEDDIIQECKSLNGRLIAFLREKKTVEQLLRYLIEPPNDPDDPKKQYRYPFTACEVFCCEVEAVFNTLLEDEELLRLLFSLLEQAPPLSCKAAGYFGRVVGQLLLRKTNEMMQHLSNNDAILERLIAHVDTTSIADIIKRLVGADDHSSMIFMPMHTQWLAETPLVDMLLDRLAPGYSPHVQANAADILTAIAHTQPSALASQLMQRAAIDALFSRALQPGSRVLVTALDVCAALLEPRRSQEPPPGIGGGGEPGGGGGGSPTAAAASAGGAAGSPHAEAIASMLHYMPQLMEHLRVPGGGGGEPAAAVEAASAAAAAGLPDALQRQETPYGLLLPPLGRARLRIVELLAALLRVGDDGVDAVIIGSHALPLVQELFVAFPFNNLLHHQMYAVLVAVLRRCSPPMLGHVFGECGLVAWLAGLPKEVTPLPRPGHDGRGALRAGYLGHVTRIGQVLQEAAAQQQDVADALAAAPGWAAFVQQELAPRLELEDVTRWQCGRPANTEGGELESDGDEFQNDMESLEQMQGMPPGMYHRYGVLDDMDDDEDDDAAAGSSGGAGAAPDGFGAAAPGAAGSDGGAGGDGGAYTADMLVAGMAGLGVHDADEGADAGAVPGGSEAAEAGASGAGVPGISNWSLLAHPGAASSAVDIPGERLMEDDAVLLADDDDMGALTASTLRDASPQPLGGGLAAAAASPPIEDLVLVQDVTMLQAGSPPSSSGSSGGGGDGDAEQAQQQPGAGAQLGAPPQGEPGPAAAAASNPFGAASLQTSEAAAAGGAQEAAAAAAQPLPAVAAAAAAAAVPAPAAAAAEQAPAAAPAALEAPAGASAIVQAAAGEAGGAACEGKAGSKRQAMSHPLEVAAEELS